MPAHAKGVHVLGWLRTVILSFTFRCKQVMKWTVCFLLLVTRHHFSNNRIDQISKDFLFYRRDKLKFKKFKTRSLYILNDCRGKDNQLTVRWWIMCLNYCWETKYGLMNECDKNYYIVQIVNIFTRAFPVWYHRLLCHLQQAWNFFFCTIYLLEVQNKMNREQSYAPF